MDINDENIPPENTPSPEPIEIILQPETIDMMNVLQPDLIMIGVAAGAAVVICPYIISWALRQLFRLK
ncbi:hypothetical protein D3C78_1538260 [compost metagenome]